MLLRRVPAVACGLCFAALAAAQDIYPLPWRTDDKGRLEWLPIAAEAGEPEPQWQPVFSGLLNGDNQTITAFDTHLKHGPFLLLPLLLTGAGGAAAIDEAPRRLRKLDIHVSFDAASRAQRDPDPLRDLLRTRYLGTLDLAAAHFTLARWGGDVAQDPFVRAAAVAELDKRPEADTWARQDDVQAGRASRNAVAALHAGLQRLPDDFELLLGVNSTALPTPASLLQAWRRMHVRIGSAVSLQAGASLSPATPLRLVEHG